MLHRDHLMVHQFWSIIPKTDEWIARIQISKPTIILTETWTDSFILITGYIVYRRDRKGQVGGGVRILVQEKVFCDPEQIDVSKQIFNRRNSSWYPEVSHMLFIQAKRKQSEKKNLHLISVIETSGTLYTPAFVLGDFIYHEIDCNCLTAYLNITCSSDFIGALPRNKCHLTCDLSNQCPVMKVMSNLCRIWY